MTVAHLEKISDNEWLFPKRDEMKTDVRFLCSGELLETMDEAVLKQAVNVASLPGIVSDVLVLPDAHWGYGFPIGSTAAFDPDEGVFSVGGVGFDINCGVRTIKTNLSLENLSEKDIEVISKKLFENVPAGLGRDGEIKLSTRELRKVMTEGSKWCLEEGYATEEDIENTEENGTIEGAIPEYVSEKAIEREKGQIGTLGSGNHYLELQVVEEIFDKNIANVMGLFKNQIVLTMHCGSRGFGHQVNSDYIEVFAKAVEKYKISIRDKELVCAPIKSKEGEMYLGAVRCAINYSFANRQVITYLVRKTLRKIFRDVDVGVLYDVAHNTVKKEIHKIGDTKRVVFVHRKGSTRSFGSGSIGLPRRYLDIGQPVIVGGSMGTYSYILLGTEMAMEKSLGSTIHGAGRALSRRQALKSFPYKKVLEDLERRGIKVLSHSKEGISEEAPQAYKDINEVIKPLTELGISKKVCKLRPLVSIKG